MASEKGGWTATGRHEEEGKGSGGGGGGGAGTMSGDLVNGAASAAAVVDGGGRSDALIAKKAGDLARTADGSVAGLENDAAADDGSVIGEAGGGSARAVGELAMVEPVGKSAMVELADDLEMAVLCGSSWEREKEAEVSANGRCVLANGDADLVSAAVKVAAGDLGSEFAINSGYAWSASGSSLTWPSLCQICP